MLADLEDGLGAVLLANGPASERAVLRYALAATRAAIKNEPLPKAPIPEAREQVENAAEFAGLFHSSDGMQMRFRALGAGVQVLANSGWVTLEQIDEDVFYTVHPDYDRYEFRFLRNEQGKVAEVFHGPGWYVNETYQGPLKFESPNTWAAYSGRYRNYSPWFPYFEVFTRKGKLMALTGTGGEVSGSEEQLIAISPGVFRVGEGPGPELLQFDDPVDRRVLRVTWSGHPFFRTP